MRQFTQKEKEFLREMISMQNTREIGVFSYRELLQKLVNDNNNEFALVVGYGGCAQCEVLVPHQSTDNLTTELAQKYIILILVLFRLIDYLNSNSLIYAEGESAKKDTIVGIPNPSNNRSGLTFELSDLIFKYLDRVVYIGEDIRYLVENDFVTEDEKRHKETIKKAECGIAVAIAIGVVGIIVSAIGIYLSFLKC